MGWDGELDNIVSYHMASKRFSGGGWVVHKVNIVSVHIPFCCLSGYKKFSGGGWVVQKVNMVCVLFGA